MCYNFDFSQDIIISCSKNIILKHAIDLNLITRKNNPSTKILSLGPESYFKAITEILISKQLNKNPSYDDILILREIINNSKSIKTYREEPPFNNILYNHKKNDEYFDFGFHKNLMYNNENIKHWTITNNK